MKSPVTEKDEAKKAHSVAPCNNGMELGPFSALILILGILCMTKSLLHLRMSEERQKYR